MRDYFRPDIDPNTALSQVSALASSDLYYLPPGTIPPMVMPYDPTAALLTVSSDTADETKLYDVAYFSIRNMLSGISGTIAPAVFGGRIRRIYVYVDPVKLAARGMSALDVAEALRKWNTLIPTGDAKIGALDYFVVANGMAPTVEEINDFPLRVTQGAPIFVKDIGHAQDTFQIQTNVVHVNGRRQVYIPIYLGCRVLSRALHLPYRGRTRANLTQDHSPRFNLRCVRNCKRGPPWLNLAEFIFLRQATIGRCRYTTRW